MEKLRTWLPIILVVAGFGLIYVGTELSVPLLIHVGLLPIGGGLFLFGWDAIQKRRSSYTGGEQDASQTETYFGLAAVMDGIVLVLLGIAVFVLGVILIVGLGEYVLEKVQERPGSLMVFVSALLIATSITWVLGSQESREGWALVGSLPKRIAGVIFFILGVTLGTLALIEMVSPQGFDQILKLFAGWLGIS